MSKLVFVTALSIAALGAAATTNANDEFYEGLIQRRLFFLAETLCQDQLATEDLPARERVDWTTALIRVYSAHAINSSIDERDKFWESARTAAAEFQRAHGKEPGAILVRVQEALALLARGELLRQEVEAEIGRETALETARSVIRDSANLLEDLDKELTREIPLRSRDVRTGQLTDTELFALQNNVRYQFARALRNRALCYDGPDKLAALQQAISTLKELPSRIEADDELQWDVKLDLAICYRLAGNQPEARRHLNIVNSSSPPPKIALHARAEVVRLALDANQPDIALEQLQRGRDIQGVVSAELDFAHLETYAAKWRDAEQANDENAVKTWREGSKKMVGVIDRLHGPYWRRRADRLLVKAAEIGGGSEDYEILVRKAESHYLKNEFAEAIAAYESAGQAAVANNDRAQALGNYYRAGLIEHQRKNHAEAAKRLTEIATLLKEQPKAADTHLLGVWNYSRLASKDHTSATAYTDALTAHIAFWPSHPTADKARMWLGRWCEHERKWSEALTAFLAVSRESAEFPQAVESASRCAEGLFAELKVQQTDYTFQAAKVAVFFEGVVILADGSLPATWTPTTRLAALTAARIRLQHSNAGAAQASDMLTAALSENGGSADETWQNEARALLVVALASQPGKRNEAIAQLRQIADASPQRLLEMTSGLMAIAENATEESRVEMAGIQLESTKLLLPHRDRLSETGKLLLDRVRAESLALAGDSEQAELEYAALAAENPRSARIQKGYAQLLLSSSSNATLKKALGQWRRVAQSAPPKSDLWLEAKYSIALAHYKLGDKKSAKQLIEYTGAIPPGYQGTQWETEFTTLLNRCR